MCYGSVTDCDYTKEEIIRINKEAIKKNKERKKRK